jgi:amino acid transporter
MGRWSLVALVINSIIGSGIFGLPSLVAANVGPASALAYLPAALGMGVIMACFAEVASRFRQAGGPYLYARVAFGRLAGIEVGWVTWLSRLTAAAANANLFVIYLAEFWEPVHRAWPRLAALTILVGVLSLINYRGVRGGARQSNVFVIAKLVPLLLFVGVGLFFIHPGHFSIHAHATADSWLATELLLVFAFGGFEGAIIPMSEAKDPQRDAPFALFVALAAVTAVYVLAQVVVTGVLPSASASDRPLAAAARVFAGSAGAGIISLGALISVYGLLSSLALYSPRLTYAFAEQKDFPAIFAAVHRRFRTPHFSIAVFGVLVWGLAVAGSFQWNLTLSAIARLFTYGFTCAAMLAFRKRPPEKEGFRLPAGGMFAVLGMLFCLVLVTRMGWKELEILLVTCGVGLANWAWVRKRPLALGLGKDEGSGRI